MVGVEHMTFLRFQKVRRALEAERDGIAFGAGALRTPRRLIDEHDPDWPRRQACRAVRADDGDPPGREVLVK